MDLWRKNTIISWRYKTWDLRSRKSQSLNKSLNKSDSRLELLLTLHLPVSIQLSITLIAHMARTPFLFPTILTNKLSHRTVEEPFSSLAINPDKNWSLFLKYISRANTKEPNSIIWDMVEASSTTMKVESMLANGNKTKWMEKVCFTIPTTA